MPRYIVSFALLLMLFQPFTNYVYASPQFSASIYGRVVDANTGLPIPNATVLVWDLNTLEKPKLGSGIYLTDENGEYNVTGEYLKAKHTYRIYAYKGDLAVKVDYVPAVKKLKLESFEGKKEVNFSLIPGALIELKGTPYLVQSSSPGGRVFIKVLDKTGSDLILNVPFIHEYGSSVDAWFLGLSEKQIIVPANTPVILESQIWFFSKEQYRVGKEVFHLYNGSSPFLLPQAGKATIQMSSYSLRSGLDFITSKLEEVTIQLNEMQRVGFVVFEERRSLADTQQKIIEASITLTGAQGEDDYRKVWAILRTELGKMNLVSMNLQNMRFVSVTSAVYLPGIMAVFSVVLAFFFFENERKKIFSSIMIYIVFLFALYFLYPGAHIVIDENVQLFLESVAVSSIGVLAIVLGIPRVWKERTIEGEVSWKSAVSIIFSMGKRQIRRKKIRGFFTILSIIILILAFTSLTSFGTVFGIVSDRLDAEAPSDGVMVKRMLNETLLSSPLGSEDPEILSEIMKISNVALRYESIPRSPNPIARLVNKDGKDWLLYGVLAVTPTNESIYSHLDETVEDGNYLSENRDDEILISMSVAKDLDVKVGENVTLNIIGVGVSCNFIIRGIINDEKYMSLVDVDGASLGPPRLLSDGSLRICNSTEIVIMNWKAAEKLQEMINLRFSAQEKAPRFAILSEIVFQPEQGANIDSVIRTLIFVFNYDVFISSNRVINYYHIGSYFEFKGVTELLVPLVMVVLNVSMVMLNSVYERRREIRTLSILGLNPTHIGLIFVAEAVILGMVGGSLGYLFGLGFYRVMIVFGQELMVREKLEWWWSVIGFAIALTASVLSAIRPAALAVSTYTPSKIKKLKLAEEEMEARREKIFKVYQARELSMPVKVKLNEVEFFVGFLINRLDELRAGHVEKVDNVEEMPEIENVKGELVRSIRFDYRFEVSGREKRTKNNLILLKSPKEDYYRVRLVSEPATPGMPEDSIDVTVDFVHDIMLYWAKNKERIIGI